MPKLEINQIFSLEGQAVKLRRTWIFFLTTLIASFTPFFINSVATAQSEDLETVSRSGAWQVFNLTDPIEIARKAPDRNVYIEFTNNNFSYRYPLKLTNGRIVFVFVRGQSSDSTNYSLSYRREDSRAPWTELGSCTFNDNFGICSVKNIEGGMDRVEYTRQISASEDSSATDSAAKNSMEVYKGSSACNFYAVEPVSNHGIVNLYVPNSTDLSNFNSVATLARAHLVPALQQSSARCQGGIAFTVVHQKNLAKCPPAIENDDTNFVGKCLKQNDVDYASINIEAPNNRHGWEASNFRYEPGPSTTASINAAKLSRAQAAKDANAQLEANAESKRAANIAAFKRQSAATLASASRGYGAAAINRMVDECFANYAKDAVCKDFRISSAQYRSPSRADIANGITSIIDVKAFALSKRSPTSQWRDICSFNTFIQVKNGPWKLSASYSNC